MVHLLERAHAPAGHRRASADDEHRAVVALRLGERRGRVRHARPGGDRGHAALARDLGPTLGGERGRLLVPKIDHADAMLDRARQHRPDVRAVEGEQVTDCGALERKGDQLAGVA